MKYLFGALVWTLVGLVQPAHAEPITLTTLAIYGMITTAMAGAFSAYTSSQASKFQAKIANQRAEIADDMAQDALERGQEEKRKQRERTAQLVSQQEAELAAAGIALGEGSAVDLIADTAYVGEIDARIIENNAVREAYGHELTALGQRADAGAYGFQARVGPAATLLNTGSTILGQAGQFKAAGAFE